MLPEYIIPPLNRGYKYPLASGRRCRAATEKQQRSSEKIRRFEMVCSRCVTLVLVLHVVMDQVSAVVLPNSSRTKREVDWWEQELFSHSDPSDVSVGDAGDVRRDGDTLAPQSETAAAPTPLVPVQNQHQNQNRRTNENRLKVARLDPISRFQFPTFRKRKEKTNFYREE